MTTPPPASPQTLVIWHGYLLGATGSNIYTHHLVDSWVRAGHDVVLACQEPDPNAHPRIHEVLRLARDEASGTVTVAAHEHVRQPEPGHGRCSMVVPDIHGLLPVYVIDRYAGFEVVRVPDLSDARLASYAADHDAAMRWVIERFAPDGVLINHASPLPAALAPSLVKSGIAFAVKVHGSELEYALVEDQRLVEPAANALAQATSILVGSDHIAVRTRELLGTEAIAGRTHVVPPGVDLERFRPIERSDAARSAALDRLVQELTARADIQTLGRTETTALAARELVEAIAGDAARAATLVPGLTTLHASYEQRHVEQTAADAARGLVLEDRALMVYVGKLIPQKGVHLLLAALPRVLEAHPGAQLVVAGFGPLRDGLEAQLVAMTRRDEASLDALANGMGALSGEGGAQLTHLRAYLDALRERSELDAWLDLAADHRVDEHVSWLGLVDHGVLEHLWPLAEVSIVPSVLAEAFGMVAAEAASCGCVPLVSDHSGLADAASVIELDGVAPVRFDIADPARAIDSLADALIARLDLDEQERARQSAAVRANVARAWGWDQLSIEVAQLMTTRDEA